MATEKRKRKRKRNQFVILNIENHNLYKNYLTAENKNFQKIYPKKNTKRKQPNKHQVLQYDSASEDPETKCKCTPSDRLEIYKTSILVIADKNPIYLPEDQKNEVTH